MFNKLYDENITVKERNYIIDLIDKRFSEICEKLLKKADKERAWYDYGNVPYESEGVEGDFDIFLYKENVDIGGEYIEGKPGYEDMSFPTRWLWEENWEEELNNNIEKAKALEIKKKKDKKEYLKNRKNRIEELKVSIRNKLTDEEWKILKFKK